MLECQRCLDEHRNQPTEQEEPDDFGFLPCGRDGQHREEQPQEPILLQSRANEFVSTPCDDRDDGSSNAVEHSLNPRQPPVMHVERGKGHDHQKRRQDKRGPRQRRAKRPRPDPTEIHRKLCCEGAGGKLRKGNSLDVILTRYPLPLLDQVLSHMAREGKRSAEAKGAEVEKIKQDFAQIWLRLSTLDRDRARMHVLVGRKLTLVPHSVGWSAFTQFIES